MRTVEIEGWGFVQIANWNEFPLPWEAEAWPLSFAVLWIAWRDREAVEQEWRNILSHGFRLDDAKEVAQRISLRDAQSELWNALRTAKLEATAAFAPDADRKSVRPRAISPRRWVSFLRFVRERDNLVFESDVETKHYGYVTVASARVSELWPELSKLVSPQTDVIGKPKPGPGKPGDKSKELREYLRGLGSVEDVRREKLEALAQKFGFEETSHGAVSRVRKEVMESWKYESLERK